MDDTRVGEKTFSLHNRKLDHPQNDNNRLIKFTDENVIKKFFSPRPSKRASVVCLCGLVMAISMRPFFLSNMYYIESKLTRVSIAQIILSITLVADTTSAHGN